MNCRECGGVYEAKSDLLTVFDFYVGKIVVRDTPYYECRNCHDILYTEQMSRAIERERAKRIHELLRELPLGAFISSSEVTSILDVTRQALHKNRRIKRGFIYQTKFAGVTVYLRDSVLRFKRTGDGRFPLQPRAYGPSTPYMKSAVHLTALELYERYGMVAKPLSPFVERSAMRRKEYSNVT